MNQSNVGGPRLQDDPKPSVRYAAIIHNVQEVTFTGTADLAFWQGALRREGLFPFNAHGSAEILISAPGLTWMGFRFRELSVDISVTQREDANQPDGLFLAHAFNTSPLLAFAERSFFSTPYYPADIQLDAPVPVRVSLTQRGKRLFNARMAAQTQPVRSGDECWAGPVYLPSKQAQSPRKRFMVSLSGESQTYAFSAGSDVLELNPTGPGDIFGQLRESGFVAHAWRIRPNATHAKSRTLSE